MRETTDAEIEIAVSAQASDAAPNGLTPPLGSPMIGAFPDPGDYAKAVAYHMAKSQASGDGGGPPPIDLKKFRRGNWWVQLLMLIGVAASGTFAAYKATEARSVHNEKAIEAHKAQPMHPEAAKRLIRVETDIAQTKTALGGEDGKGGIKADVKQIANGIEQLKIEARTEKQKRLEEKVKALERENRRLENLR